MTTYQKASLLKSMQKLDHEVRTSRYPAVLDAPKYRWFRVEIGGVMKGRHFVDVEAIDNFDATREALEQNKSASWAKVVRAYNDGEPLLGNW